MSSCRNSEHDGSVLSAQKPHFFKIISEDSLRDGKLLIPAKFVRKHLIDASVSVKVMLKVPRGKKWDAELSRSDGKMWLQNGWKEFVEHYSLKYGDFVVFSYQGDCNFQVLIFDKSCTEVEYPELDTGDDDLSIEILNKPPSSPKRKERLSPPCTCLCKTNKTDSTQEAETNSYSQPKTSEKKRARAMVGQKGQEARARKRMRTLNGKEKSKALQKAASFKSKNPFFPALMQPSFLRLEYRMNIPWCFVNAHLKRSHENIILHFNGKTWPVKYFYSAGGTSRSQFAQLRGGWKTFAQDNNLAVGDVCVFEIIDGLKKSWKVVIYRGAEDATLHSSSDDSGNYPQGVGKKINRAQKHAKLNFLGRSISLNSGEKARAVERAKSFKSNKPLFRVAMQPSYVTGGGLNIPSSFVRKHLSGVGEAIRVTLRISNGRTWTVSCKTRLANRQLKARFSDRSWKAFVRDNNLEVGDVCVLELDKGKKIVFDVVVFHAATDAGAIAP